MDLLSPSYHVLAPDSYGAGKGPPWPTDRTVSLGDEVALFEPVFARAGDPFALVGHSYGGAVALVAAVTQPARIRCLVLFEPTLFALLDAEQPQTRDADGIRNAVAAADVALAKGDLHRAAEHFIDFWMGPGSWARTPEPRKAPIAASMVNVRGWGTALFGEPTPLWVFGRLEIPVLYILGTESPASSRGVGRLLTAVLPQVSVLELDGVGHMGPLTHPAIVNEAIRGFLGSC